MQAPGKFLFAELGQGPAERVFEARNHRRVALRQEMAQHRRGIDVGAAEQAQEILAAAPGIARDGERRNQHRREHSLATCGLVGALVFLEQGNALFVQRVQAPREHRAEQLALAAEVIIDRRQVDLGLGGHQAQAGGFEAVFHEQAFRGVEDAQPRGCGRTWLGDGAHPDGSLFKRSF